MPYHTIKILRDKEGRPIPQVYDPEIDSFVPATIHQNVSDANVLNELKKLNENNGVSHTAYNKSIDALGKSIIALEEATEAKTTANVVKDQFNQVVAEAGSNNPEVVLARGGEPNLNSRLTKINTDLAQKATKEEVRLKSSLIGLNDANPELLAAIEGGAGASFNLLSIPRDKSVTFDKTDFFTRGKNKIDELQNVVGQYASQNDGTFIVLASFQRTDYVPVTAGLTYVYLNGAKSYGSARYALYDTNKTFISGAMLNTGVQTITVQNDGYIIISDNVTNSKFMQLEEGTVATTYEPFQYLFANNFQNVLDKKVQEVVQYEHKKSKNLFDATAITNGYKFTGTSEVVDGGYFMSDFIPISSNASYVCNKGNTRVYYDKDKKVISGTGLGAGAAGTSPTGSAYVRFSSPNTNLSGLQFEIGPTSTPFEKFYDYYIPKNFKTDSDQTFSKLKNKKIIATGDSIVEGLGASQAQSWVALLGENTLSEVVNYGIGGSTISVNPSSPTERNPIINRYALMDDDADVVIVAAGTNDFTYTWTTTGTMESRSNNEFYGALHNLCSGLIDKYPGKIIMFMTPIKRHQSSFTTPIAQNANGNVMQDYVDIIKEVCGYYGIPVLDMFRECTIFPFTEEQRTLYIPDGVHPNDEGHKIMVRLIQNRLEQLV